MTSKMVNIDLGVQKILTVYMRECRSPGGELDFRFHSQVPIANAAFLAFLAKLVLYKSTVDRRNLQNFWQLLLDRKIRRKWSE